MSPDDKGGSVNPLWQRLNAQTDEGYELLRCRSEGGVEVTESPDYHAHDAWGIRHVHGGGTEPHVHEMEILAGKSIPIPPSGRTP